MPPQPPTPLSIFDLSPIETGGTVNRRGLAFQDHVALSFCLNLLLDETLIEVWCETQDDITLLWRDEDSVAVEFVQAKSNELDQLWSTSELCVRDKGKEGTSIVERSLTYDRCRETTQFRIVTARPFKSDLRPLTLQPGCKERAAVASDIEILKDAFEEKLGSFQSPNAATCRDWVERVRLDTRHSEQALHDSNVQTLRVSLEERGFSGLHDQIEEIYSRLLAEVFEAGRAAARTEAAKKRFSKERFEKLLNKLAEIHLRYPMAGGGKALQQKMEDAGLPDDTIAQAQEHRRSYRFRSLQPKYQQSHHAAGLEQEVGAILHSLKAQLDVGALPEEGGAFHAACLQALSEFRHSFPIHKEPSLADLYGCMYVIADRCLHRFRRLRL